MTCEQCRTRPRSCTAPTPEECEDCRRPELCEQCAEAAREEARDEAEPDRHGELHIPARDVDVGDLIEHDRKLWRVVSVTFRSAARDEVSAAWRRRYGSRLVVLGLRQLDGTRLPHGLGQPLDHPVRLLREHHPVCGQCGQLWPCEDERIERETAQYRRDMRHACVVCGKPTVNSEGGVGFVDGAYYHTHGSGPWRKCRKAYLRAKATQDSRGLVSWPDQATTYGADR